MSNNPAAIFRYVHLSDLHFSTQPWRTNILFKRALHKTLDTFDKSAPPENEWNSLVQPASFIPEIASGVARFCHWLNRKFDGIIISGDLATTGQGGDLRVAKAFVAEPPSGNGPYIRYNEPTISGTISPENIHIVPGNHDRYRDDFGTPGSPHFELTFKDPFMRNYDGEVGHWIKQKSGRKLAFVYADFSLRRRNDVPNRIKGPYGQGRVYADILRELKRKTKLLRDGGIPVVWIIHFAPWECESSLQMIDFSKVTEAAKSLDVLCTLCGHTHIQNNIIVNGHQVYCAGSSCCVDSKMKSKVHTVTIKIDDDGCYVSRQNFQWSWDQDAFIAVGSD